MSGQKTEKPTPKKLADARRQGTVAKSQDLTGAATMLAVLAVMSWYGVTTVSYLSRLLKQDLKNAFLPVTPEAFASLLSTHITHLLVVAAPFLIAPLVIGVAVNLFQVQPMITPEAILPKWSRLNILKGIQNLFSRRALVQLIKSVLKMAFVAGVAIHIVQANLPRLMTPSDGGAVAAFAMVFSIVTQMAFSITGLLLALGAADWFYQKYEMTKSLMMSRQDVKDEMRNMEGNPELKSKIRSKGRSFATKRMLAAVPMADVVLINPTHYSVALKYDPDIAPAPRVVAKGVDHMAFKIREIAKANNIPLYDNPPLTRSIYNTVEQDYMIPPELFSAVADVLAFVYRRQGSRKKRAKTRNATLAGALPGGVSS